MGQLPDQPAVEDRDALRAKAIAKLTSWGVRKHAPCKQWRTTGDIDVPGWVLRELAAERLIEARKRSGSSPTEWRWGG